MTCARADRAGWPSARTQWVGGRVKADSDHAILKAYLSKLAKAKSTVDNNGEGDAFARLSEVVKNAAVGIDDVKKELLATTATKVKVLMEKCSDCMTEIKWPCADEVNGLEWGKFKKSVGSWLDYSRGDVLRADGVELASMLTYYKSCYEMFGSEMPVSDIDTITKVTAQVEALVFAVKALKAMEKTMESDNKMKRYAASKLKELDKESNSALKLLMPAPLLAKLRADRLL